jgi:hypothetical protein
LHNEFSGTAWVGYVVEENGQVNSPRILRQNWQPTGNSVGEPLGYEQAILYAVAKWRFSPQPKKCWNETPIEISFEDLTGSFSTRSNNALKCVAGLSALHRTQQSCAA